MKVHIDKNRNNDNFISVRESFARVTRMKDIRNFIPALVKKIETAPKILAIFEAFACGKSLVVICRICATFFRAFISHSAFFRPQTAAQQTAVL